jgi:uncharacterized protein (TIGR03435 family)
MLLGLAAFLTLAQSFDVASVKPVQLKADLFNINLGKTSHGELTLGNASLADCIKFAFGLTSDIQLTGPAWMFDKTVPFDIAAKAPPDTAREQLLLMLQGLLVERFQLQLHHEQRPASYLALTPARKGPVKMTQLDPAAPLAANRSVPGQIDSHGMYLTMLARVLSRFLRQPVIDQTGLTGLYVFMEPRARRQPIAAEWRWLCRWTGHLHRRAGTIGPPP